MKSEELFLYTEKEAIAELKKRQKISVKDRVEAWWIDRGWPMPDFLPSNGNCWGILPRQVATARVEDIVFHRRAKNAGLEPVWLEYTADRFSISNIFKKSLMNLPVKKGDNITVLKLGSASAANGKKISSLGVKGIPANGAGSLVDYHHVLQEKVFRQVTRYDISGWLESFGSARNYYLPFLSMFVGHAVLFENYYGDEYEDESERAFDERVFKPAYSELFETFGLAPIIVEFRWKKEMQFYPGKYHSSVMAGRKPAYAPELLKMLS